MSQMIANTMMTEAIAQHEPDIVPRHASTRLPGRHIGRRSGSPEELMM